MDKIGTFAVKTIKTRIQLGKGVDSELGAENRLKPLALSTKRKRQRSKLSSKTRPSKSNLTETGKMLDEMFYKKESGGKLTISIKDSSRTDSNVTNRRLASIHHNEKGRPFFHMSKQDFRKIFQFIRREIVKPLIDKIN